MKGQAGGRALYRQRGSEYMRQIGLNGARKFYERYEWRPYGQSQFALVLKSTGEIVAFSDGAPVGRRSAEAAPPSAY